MVVQKRRASKKRHTTHWKISGKWYTRKQAVDLAKKGKIPDVKVSSAKGIEYISGRNYSLYDLETVVA